MSAQPEPPPVSLSDAYQAAHPDLDLDRCLCHPGEHRHWYDCPHERAFGLKLFASRSPLNSFWAARKDHYSKRNHDE